MIRARNARPCAVLRREASDVNSARSKMARGRYLRVDLDSAELEIQDAGLRSLASRLGCELTWQRPRAACTDPGYRL
jgi:hypothetical protein